jgi:serine/threonine protein kinase/WD40 repeat protein/tetratricopeptide (TPR) repeat protein
MNRMGAISFPAGAGDHASGAPGASGPPAAELLPPPELALKLRTWQRSAWERGELLSVEQILADYPKIADDPESVVDLIYHEYLLRERAGRRPELDELSARFPQHAVALRKQIAFHLALEGTAAGHDPRPAPAETSEAAPLAAPAIPGYEIVEEIGFGGTGVLYRARQIGTNRPVAIKVLSAGAYAAPAQRARFRAEAELIARLQHPNVVQIYEAGEEHGCPYLVLEYMGGGSLRDRLHGVPQAPRAAAQLLEVVSRALEAAHAAGIVHRDLTPGNILFAGQTPGHEGSPTIDAGQPKISDFGLAKLYGAPAETDSACRTMTGDVIGTPAYMSPEQAAGRTSAIGRATDIYSLGAILYELLTGRPPLRGVTPVETLQRVVASEPVPPSRLQPGLAPDLETICLKCLQKQPTQRYSSAAELAEDLRRYLAGEPILARPVGSLTKFARWCRRKPLLAGLASLVALLLAVVVAGSITAAVRLNQAALDRLAEAKLAEARVHRLDNQLGRRDKSLAALAHAARIHATEAVRDEAIASLPLFDLKFDHAGPSTAGFIDLSPDLKIYARQVGAGEVVIRRVGDEAEICRFQVPQPVSGGVFSPDGKHLVCRWPNAVRIEVWFVGNSEPRLVFSDDCDVFWGMGALNFSADSRQVVVGRPDGLVRVYGLEDGKCSLEFRVPPRIAHLACHPLHPQLAVATQANLQIRDLRDGRLLVQLDEAAGSEYVSWHPQGTILATSDADSGISLWEPDQLRRRQRLAGHAMGGLATAFNPSGTLLFSAGWDGSLRVWDPYWGRPLFTSIGSNSYFLRFSPDDRFWAGDIAHGKIQVWRFPEAPAYRRLTAGASFDLGHIRTLAFSPAGVARGRLLAVAMERGVGFWDVRTGQPLGHLPIGFTADLAFDQTGNLLTANAAGTRFWPVREAAEGGIAIGPPQGVTRLGTVSQMAISADGRMIGLSRRYEGGCIVDRDHPDRVIFLRPESSSDDVLSIALTPDGKLAVTAGHNGPRVRVWDASSGALIHEFPPGGSRVAFSADGRTLLTTANGLELWSVDGWQRLWQGGATALSPQAFSPDGRFVAVDPGTGQIILHAAGDGRVIARLNDPYPAALHHLAVGPDGLWVAGISRDLQQLFVWNLDSAVRTLAAIGAPCELPFGNVAEPVPTAPLALEIRLEDSRQRLLDELRQCQNELQSRPQDGTLQLQLGRLLTRLGRDEEARGALVAAVESGESFAALHELAACCVRLERWPDALAAAQRILALPSLSSAQQGLGLNALAWYLTLAPEELRNPERATECVHRALELEPENMAYVNTLGMALYRQHELALAIEAFRTSLRRTSLPVFDLLGLALCYQSAGDFGRAADFFSRADYLRETHASGWSRQEQIELDRLREEYRRRLPADGERR